MGLWLIGVIVMLLVWARLWQTQPKMAFGVFLGLLLAWLFSRLTMPYLTGEAQMPLWLPPLPFAIVAITLFVFGALVWIRAARRDHRRGDHRRRADTSPAREPAPGQAQLP